MVASYTQLLSRRCADQLDDEGREFMRYILEGVQNMQRLLEDLLSYSLQLRPLDKPASAVDSEASARAIRLHSFEQGVPSIDNEFHPLSEHRAAAHSHFRNPERR